MNKKEGGPLYKRIEILGSASSKNTESITQATFTRSLIKYISKDPQADMDFYRRNNDLDQKLPYPSPSEESTYILRKIFIDDKNDYIIAQILYNYFYSVSQKWPNSWNNTNQILNKSIGVLALMQFFGHAYTSFSKPNGIISKEEFQTIFNPINIADMDFGKEKYAPDSSGQEKLYRELLSESGFD